MQVSALMGLNAPNWGSAFPDCRALHLRQLLSHARLRWLSSAAVNQKR